MSVNFQFTCSCAQTHWLRAGICFLSLALCSNLGAIVFVNSADPDHNTTAPTASYADAGWQFEGEFGVYTGTAIGDQYFITAQHFGVAGSTFVQSSVITGGGEAAYSVDTAANGGLG